MILISFEHLQKILIFPKFQGCNSKIVPATPFWILKFKWAWQTQFLSHNLVTLKNCVFFVDLQMILVSFFDVSNPKSVISKKPISVSRNIQTQPVSAKIFKKYTIFQSYKVMALKLSLPCPFEFQNSKGRGRHNFWVTTLKLWKN